MTQSPNRILNSLPQNIFAALEPHLRIANLKFGYVIAETDQPVSNVYFPHSGIISLVVEMDVGDIIETAMVGRDGVANATSALDGKMALHKGLVQADGAASVINPDTLRNSQMSSRHFAQFSSATSKSCWRKFSSRPDAMPVIPWKRGCVGGFCASGTLFSRMM
jgi:hypothetical protein